MDRPLTLGDIVILLLCALLSLLVIFIVSRAVYLLAELIYSKIKDIINERKATAIRIERLTRKENVLGALDALIGHLETTRTTLEVLDWYTHWGVTLLEGSLENLDKDENNIRTIKKGLKHRVKSIRSAMYEN